MAKMAKKVPKAPKLSQTPKPKISDAIEAHLVKPTGLYEQTFYTGAQHSGGVQAFDQIFAGQIGESAHTYVETTET